MADNTQKDQQQETFTNVQSLDQTQPGMPVSATPSPVPTPVEGETFSNVKMLSGVEAPKSAPAPVQNYQPAPGAPSTLPPVPRPQVNMEEQGLIPTLLGGQNTEPEGYRKMVEGVSRTPEQEEKDLQENIKQHPYNPLTTLDPGRLTSDFSAGREKMTAAGAQAGAELGHAYVQGAVNQKGPGGGYYVPAPVEHPLTEEQVRQQHPIAYGVAGGVGGFAGGFLSDPVNVAMLASGSEGPVLLRKAADIYFAAEGAKGMRQQFLDLAKNWDNMTQDQKAESLSNASMQAFLLTAAGKDLVKGTLHPTADALKSASHYVAERAAGKGKVLTGTEQFEPEAGPRKYGQPKANTEIKPVEAKTHAEYREATPKGPEPGLMTSGETETTPQRYGAKPFEKAEPAEYREATPRTPEPDLMAGPEQFDITARGAEKAPAEKSSGYPVAYAEPTEFAPEITKEKVDEVRAEKPTEEKTEGKKGRIFYHGSDEEGARKIEDTGKLSSPWDTHLTPDRSTAEAYAKSNGGKVHEIREEDLPKGILDHYNETGRGPIVVPRGTEVPVERRAETGERRITEGKAPEGAEERRVAERRASLTTPTEVQQSIKEGNPVKTAFDVTEGAKGTVERDKNMPKHPAESTPAQIKAHEVNGGSTFDVNGNDMSQEDTHAVGAYPDRTVQVDKLTPEVLDKFKKDNADILDKNHAIGTWHDPEANKDVLDVARLVKDRKEAIQVGKDANQKSIYHLKSGELIETGGTGDFKNTTKASPKEYQEALQRNPTVTDLIRNHGKPMTPEQISAEMKDNDLIQWVKNGKPQDAFVSVGKDGNISRIVNNVKDAVDSLDLIRAAKERGGNKIDAWDIGDHKLVDLYKNLGFEVDHIDPYDAKSYGDPSDAYKNHWKRFGWKEGDKLPDIVYMKLKEEPTEVEKNASGESSASQEAINRAQSQKSQGIKTYRVDTRSGKATPIPGVDAPDAKANPYEKIVQVKGDQITEMDSGRGAQPLNEEKLLQSIKADTEQTVAQEKKLKETAKPERDTKDILQKVQNEDEWKNKSLSEQLMEAGRRAQQAEQAAPETESGGQHYNKVEGHVGDLTNNNLRELAKAVGLDPSKYDFGKRVALREGGSKHPVERIQLVKDIMTKLKPEDIERIGEQSATGEPENVGGKPARSQKARAEDAEKLLSPLWNKAEGQFEGKGPAPKATAETAKMSNEELLKHGFTQEDIDVGKYIPGVGGGAEGAAKKMAGMEKIPEKITKQFLTQEEQSLKTETSQRTAAEKLLKMPKLQEWIDIANLGAGERKWYQRGTEAVKAIAEQLPDYFDKPKDTDDFLNLLASLSPRQEITENFTEAIRAWKELKDAEKSGMDLNEKLTTKPPRGYPESAEYTRAGKILWDNIGMNRKSKIPNALKGLGKSALDMWPDLSKNKYFKVPSFAANLSGFLDRVTSDGWMAAFADMKESELQNPSSYHPLAVMTRAAAEELGWEPAEAQAAIWAVVKTLTEKGETEPAEIRKYSKDFADIAQSDVQIRAMLEDMGVDMEKLDDRLKTIAKKPEVSSRSTPTSKDSVGKLARRLEKQGREIPEPRSSYTAKDLEFGEDDTSFNPEEFGKKKGYGSAK